MVKIFSYLYDKSISWSAHRNAHYYLGGISFIESSFFPIPPDVMLVTMGLAKPNKIWSYAWIATLCSVAGGVLGYLIGFYAMMLIKPYLMASVWASSIQHVTDWFEHYGVWMVVLAGFTPFPYKVFTISAGAMHLSFPLFFFGSVIGRGLRFFLVCGILRLTAKRFEQHVKRYIDMIGWATLVFALGVIIWLKWFR